VGNLFIKSLGINDLEELLKIRMEVLSNVFALEKKDISKEDWEVIRKENEIYYREELEKNGHFAIALYEGDDFVGSGGLCLYKELPSPDNRSGKCAYLMNIYVRKEYRRRGIAAKICNKLIDKAKKEGIKKIYLESSDMAIDLYKSLGFEEMNGYFKLNMLKCN